MNKIVHIEVYAPHNYKSGKLILGKFRWFDIFIIIAALLLFAFVLLLNMFIIQFNGFIIIFFGIIIPMIMALMVQPLNGYHNYLEYFRIRILFHFRPTMYSGLIAQKEIIEVKKKTRIGRKKT